MGVINQLCIDAHENAVKHGFHEDLLILEEFVDNSFLHEMAKNALIAKRLMLITCEIAEAMEDIRSTENREEHFAEELSDIIIRVFDLCGELNIDLEKNIEMKMKKNVGRPYLHNKKC